MLSAHRLSLFLLGLLLIARPASAWAQEGAPPTLAPAADPLPVLTDYQSFWNLPTEASPRHYRIDYSARVLFYDPGWSILWLENQGLQFFCHPGKTRWPIRPGQLVRIEGTVFPPRGYEIEGLKLTALGPTPLPEPLDFNGRTSLSASNERLTRVRGYVERMTETDPTHLQLRLIADGYAINGIVLLTEGEPEPQLVGSIIETIGLIVLQKDPAGRILSIDQWIAGPAEIEVISSVTSDPRFFTPLTSTAQLQTEQPTQLVHVAGTVRATTPGHHLTLWDETGEITVFSAQDTPVAPGEAVEAVGFLEVKGPALHLRHAFWRPTRATTEAAAAHLHKLRRAAQVLELSPEEAARGHPVELFGVVTWSHPDSPYFYVQDSTRGVCVRNAGAWPRDPPTVGASVRVGGHTAMGPFTPLVQFEHYALIGGLSLPDAREIGLEQVLGGAEEARLVELHGYLRTVETDGPWTLLRLTSTSGEFTARMPAHPAAARLSGSVVRLHGVCTARANERRQLDGIELLLASPAAIAVAEPAPEDPFAVVAVSLGGLRQFGPLQTPYRRIRTSGRINFHEPGRLLLLEDIDDGLEVLARSSEPLPTGGHVEVVGFLGQDRHHLVLREAVFRALPPSAAPAPPPQPVPAELRPDLHNRLAIAEGRLLGQVRLGEQNQLTLRSAATTFTVLLPSAVALRTLPAESDLRCTGVYRLVSDEYGRPRGFQLQARTAADLVVVRTPPWINRGRALALAALLALGAGAAISWSLLLRRRVRTQTEQLRHQLEQQTALERELQKAAKLESLGLLAGGIAHDFNNLLTVILGNITLARLEEQVEAAVGDCLGDAERGAQRARDLTHQLLTFAKGGDPLRTAVSLSEVVREATEFVLRGSKVACAFDFARGLRVAEVDRGQIGQVVHNLVLNAVQAMSDGGTIHLTLNNATVDEGSALPLAPGPYLELTVSDTGAGMSPEVLARIFDPYFTTKKAGNGLGLATVYSIVRRHHGHIEVRSQRGHGTTFLLWLPAGTSTTATPVAPVHHALPSVVAGRRVLTMDDEEDIRRLVTTLLHRMGLEVLATTEGSDTVEAYRAALAAGRPFDLVIMDLTVPGGMGGKDAMDALLALDPDVRAIVSSGYSNDPVLADFRAFGFRGMVRKPYDIEELAACVAQILSEPAPARPTS